MSSLQHEQLEMLCAELKLQSIPEHYLDMAQQAANDESSYLSFLTDILKSEQQARQSRSRQTMVKMAGFPVINIQACSGGFVTENGRPSGPRHRSRSPGLSANSISVVTPIRLFSSDSPVTCRASSRSTSNTEKGRRSNGSSPTPGFTITNCPGCA